MSVVLNDESARPVSCSTHGEGRSVSDTDVLDWDACIETPPPRAQGTIHALIRYAGRSQPVSVSDPDSQ
jgi:hypothetical protein